MECKDVPAETLYDVLHDIEYRKKWDTNVIETFDIGKLTVNSDVGYYAWRCPKPLKNRDVVTLRSWLPMGSDYIIMNYSVKHPLPPEPDPEPPSKPARPFVPEFGEYRRRRDAPSIRNMGTIAPSSAKPLPGAFALG
ncbi:PREDICTED: PCTP-like protein [Tinamus guttatus]|uniref:PCTP-like protein n=1 Tax=Tinamus guttatus TaxID=94827 RepID=UPI00052EE48A|nr:PREDICTED: PCTP-like protein [Tinamus guttatus]